MGVGTVVNFVNFSQKMFNCNNFLEICYSITTYDFNMKKNENDTY